MMINNDNENSTNTVTTTTTQSKTTSVEETNSIMSPTIHSSQPTGEEQQSVQLTDNNLHDENESQDNQLVQIRNEEEEEEEEEPNEEDEFIRITAAHQMLTEAQTYDEQKNHPAALHLYRICVDLLLEELMFTEGTDQSRVYLREKCTAIMDRIDVLKTMLDPIPPPPAALEAAATTTTTTNSPPTDELNSLHLS